MCIDFDGTIAPWGPLMDVGAPYPGVVEAMTGLHEAGYRLVILTSRLSPACWEYEAKRRHTVASDFGAWQTGYIEGYLESYGIPYDLLTSEKVQALVYMDDRAWRVEAGGLAADLNRLLWYGSVDVVLPETEGDEL